ncbi:DUF4402 domain-containing protein [Altererythrobacter aquiaggeris]|uniref:DUF4402 domain-containing protein n=1 Tax=Aestuarierythrobacter aquiaggeris TaxID=1898396 RepID=UPI003018D253
MEHTNIGTLRLSGVAARLARTLAMGAIAAVLVAAPVHAQSLDTAAGQSEVSVIGALTITKAKDMDFGSIAGPVAGTVVMVPTATATCTPSAGLIHVNECQPALFTGAGDPRQTVRIKLPPGDSIPLTGPGTAMTVTRFVVDGDPMLVQSGKGKGFVRYEILSPSGVFAFRVGGTLNVGANQAPGVYSGSFEVRLDYK